MNDDTQVLPERTASDELGMRTAELSNAMVRIYKTSSAEARLRRTPSTPAAIS